MNVLNEISQLRKTIDSLESTQISGYWKSNLSEKLNEIELIYKQTNNDIAEIKKELYKIESLGQLIDWFNDYWFSDECENVVKMLKEKRKENANANFLKNKVEEFSNSFRPDNPLQNLKDIGEFIGKWINGHIGYMIKSNADRLSPKSENELNEDTEKIPAFERGRRIEIIDIRKEGEKYNWNIVVGGNHLKVKEFNIVPNFYDGVDIYNDDKSANIALMEEEIPEFLRKLEEILGE